MLRRLLGVRHLLKWELIFSPGPQLSRLAPCTPGVATGFWAENFSGNPDWSTGWCIHQDAFTLPTFFTFTFSVMVGMIILPVLMQKASSTFPHVSYTVLGLAGLKLIWVNSISFSILCSIHLQPGTKSVGQISSWALGTLDQSRFYKLARQGKQNHWNGSPSNYSHWSCVNLL